MSKDNSNFFAAKKPWSRVKDDLLGYYFKPYLAKILATGKPLIYVDCFAGAGKFEDGEDGSPLIIAKIIQEAKAFNGHNVRAFFLEKTFADELQHCLQPYQFATVIKGRWQDKLEGILRGYGACNLFLYIDPYGIKDLDSKFWASLSGRFNTVELLINFNSFGFFRDACRVYKVAIREEELKNVEPFLLGDDRKALDKSAATIKLSGFIGGDYWTDAVLQYKSTNINATEADRRITEGYCNYLRTKFKFSLNFPIRVKAGNIPKYRMVYATNHPDGVILMNDNICKRFEKLRDTQEHGQLQLFDMDTDNRVINICEIKTALLKIITEAKRQMRLQDIFVEFIKSHVIMTTTVELRKIIKKLEQESKISVLRIPKSSPKGKLSTFLNEDKQHKVFVSIANTEE